jgi:hypothetical protein
LPYDSHQHQHQHQGLPCDSLADNAVSACCTIFIQFWLLSQVPFLSPSTQVEHALQLADKFIRSKQVLLLTDDGFATMHGIPCMAFPNFAKQLETCAEEIRV